MIETEVTIQKLDKEVALINQRLDTIQNNHLEHLDQKVNLVLKIVATVGVLVAGQVLALLFKFIG
jgi:Mg2+ and Co2+ transporter CorA